jgi:hypothetical protein
MGSWMTSLGCLECWACIEHNTAAAALQQGCMLLSYKVHIQLRKHI